MQLSTSTLAIFAIFVAMGLIGAVTIELVAILEAEAKCKPGSTGTMPVKENVTQDDIKS